MSRRLEREIARRLKEHGAPEPPADLLGRIQAEIPDSPAIGRDAAADLRELRRPALRRPWLLAASLAAMFGAGVLSYRLFESERAPLDPASWASRAAPAPAAAPAPPLPIAPPPPENRPAAPRALPAAPPPPAAALPAGSLKKQRSPERASPALPGEEPAGAAGGVVGGVAGGVPGGAPRGEPAGAAAPPLEPAPAPVSPPAPAAAVPPAAGSPAELQAEEEPRLAQKPAPSTALGSPAVADRAAPAPPQAKSALAPMERRFRAAAQAAPAAKTPPAAEGAPSPFAGEGRRIVLLLLPPEAEVSFDPAVVSSSRRSGPAGPGGVLYEAELRPGAPAEGVVAGRNGEPLLRVRDLAPSFDRASAGFRLAALEAAAAALQAGTRPRSELPELRRLARALAGELPADPRAAALLSRLDRLSP